MRKKHSATKTNLIIAAIVHIILIVGLTFFVSREGMLGTQMKILSASLIPKTKPKVEESQKIKTIEPKIDSPRISQIPIEPPKSHSSSIPITPPTMAPESVQIPSLAFSDGAKDVTSTTDPILLYKSYIER